MELEKQPFSMLLIDILMDIMGSDHCPVSLDIEICEKS